MTGGAVRAGAVIAAIAALVGGCGGGEDGPSAEERRAAMERWVRAADEACRKAEAAIVERGEPLDLRDVDRVVVRAVADVRRAAETIRKLRIPPGGGAKVRPVLETMKELEAPLKDISEWSEVAKADELVKAAELWRVTAWDFERRAGEAGLRVCGRPGQRYAVADAIIAPVFSTQVLEFQQTLYADLQSVRKEARVTDRRSLSAYLKQFSAVVEYAAQRYYTLNPPTRAADESGAYHDTLLRTADLAGQWSREARQRRFTPQYKRTLQRRFLRLGRESARAARALDAALHPPRNQRKPPEDPDDAPVES